MTDTKPQLLYILSPSFSGSTLLTLLLAQHQAIASIGELKATAMGDVSDYVCSCGERISDCGFWEGVRRETASRNINFSVEDFGTHFSSDNAFYRKILGAQVRAPWFEAVRRLSIGMLPGLRAQFSAVLEKNIVLAEIITELQQGQYFLDGSKDPHRLLYFQQSGRFDIKVIRIHRDGRAQSNSRREKPRNPVDFLGASNEWKHTIEQMDHVCKRFPADKLHTLKYEDLCQEPQKKLEEIWDFLGVDNLERNWVNVDLKASEHHILGNRMRMKDEIKIRLDQRWAEKISSDEFDVFERVAGDLNRSLGYSSQP